LIMLAPRFVSGHVPALVTEVALELADDGRHQVAEEGLPAPRIEPVHGLDEALAGRTATERVDGLTTALVS
jgi:hypothetical protein